MSNLVSLSEQIESIKKGSSTVHGIVADCVEKIRRFNKTLNAFVTVFEDASFQAADSLDQLYKHSRPTIGSLCGAPLAVKDNFWVAKAPTTASIRIFENFLPTIDAKSVSQLRAADGIILGKNNMHALALGATSTSSMFGPVVNPFDSSRIAGGSSGGTAVAVATGMASAGLGTDTGGSVRIPATFCRIAGFKPSYGLLSLEGVIPLSYTLDHVGILAKSSEDCKLVLESMLLNDRTTTDEHDKTFRIKSKVKIGIPKAFCSDLDSEVDRDFHRALDNIQDQDSAILQELEIGDPMEIHEARVAIMLREAATIYSKELDQERSLFPPDVLSLLVQGSRIEMSRYVDATRLRSLTINRCLSVFASVDCLMLPTVPIMPPRVEEVQGKEGSEIRKKLLRNTSFANLTGFPALSLPVREGHSNSFTSIQLMSNYGTDIELLNLGSFFFDRRKEEH